jgi:hypothetical protein
LEARGIVSNRHSAVSTLTYISAVTGKSAGAGQAAMNYLKQRLNGHGGISVPNPEGHTASPTTPHGWPGINKTVHKEQAGIERSAP